MGTPSHVTWGEVGESFLEELTMEACPHPWSRFRETASDLSRHTFSLSPVSSHLNDLPGTHRMCFDLFELIPRRDVQVYGDMSDLWIR